MSASKEKKKRIDSKTEGSDKRSVQAKEESARKKKFRIRAIIAAVVVIVIVCFAVLLNTDFMYNHMTAFTVDGQKYTIADFNYWYGTAYMDFYENNAEYMEYGYYFNTAKSLRTQYPDKEDTSYSWADYFKDSALNTIKNVQAICQAAHEEGFELTEEQQANIRSSMNNIDYKSLGYTSLKNYFESVYGRGVTEKVYLKNFENMYLAAQYSNNILGKYDFTEDEIIDYYAEHSEEYDRFIYNMYYVAADKKDDEESASPEAMSAAREIAEDLAGAKTVEEFAERIRKYCSESELEKYSDPENFQYSYTASGLSATFKDWLVSDAATPNATTIIDMKNGYYVLFFIEQGGNNYNVVNYRRIVINVATDPDTGMITDTTATNAYNAAQGIYNMVSRDPTEDNFITTASSYSSEGAADLISNVSKDMTHDNVEDWLFDEARQPGDISEPIIGDNCYYILYYQGQGEVYWRYIAERGLTNQTFNDWLQARMENMEAHDRWIIRFADYRARS